MTLVHLLAQIETGNANWDYFINTLLPIVGPIGVLVIGLIVLAAYILKSTSDARVKRSLEEVRQQTIVNNLAEKLPQIEAELREEQKARYVAEGRANAHEKQIQYLQEKFDTREKESARDYRKLKSAYLRIDKRLKELGLDLQKEKEENTRLNEALNSALRSANNLQTQLEASETLRKSDKAAWDKEKYGLEETIHQLHEDIRAMKEITVALDDAVLDQLDVTEVDKEFQSADTPSPSPTLGEPPTEA